MSSTSTSSLQTHRLPPWPPSITDTQLEYLSLLSSSWALAHGFVLLPPPNPHAQQRGNTAHKQGIPAPLALFPTPFPRDLFQEAREIQWLYNALYARIALDWDFLDGVYAESIAKVDTFQGALWSGWKRIREEIVQVSHQTT
jgi:glutathione synthase